MSQQTIIPQNLVKDCERIGYAGLNSWFKEHEIQLAKGDNWINVLADTISEGNLTLNQLNEAVAELDENSDKRIFLMQTNDSGLFTTNKQNILKELQKFDGIKPGQNRYVNGQPASNGNPTFVYMYWEGDLLKIKYSEMHTVIEPDYENSNFNRIPKRVNIIYVIDTKQGFIQMRIDSAGTVHHHKDDNKKSTETAFDDYYKEQLKNMFPLIGFTSISLVGVANHIANNETLKFRINKGVTTITNNAKQTFATGSSQADVRNLPEYQAAAERNGTGAWRTEDLTGYWVAASSNGMLKKDLFMRISRRNSQIRIQRGCLEQELNYGITEIRSIQNQI